MYIQQSNTGIKRMSIFERIDFNDNCLDKLARRFAIELGVCADTCIYNNPDERVKKAWHLATLAVDELEAVLFN